MGEIDDGALAAYLGELARELHAEDDVAAVLERVVGAAVTEVPGTDYAAVSVIGRNGASTPVYTDDLVVLVDAAQYETGQGPCLDAAVDRHTVRADDLDGERRWPEFAARAVELGVRSMLSFQLFTEAGSVGALNLYARTAAAFPSDAERIGLPLAAHAAVAMVVTRQEANLRAALDTRDLIGQAKGILMERYKIDQDRAFKLLLMVSQRTNTKLREVADRLCASGDLPIRMPGRVDDGPAAEAPRRRRTRAGVPQSTSKTS
jgi:GAF domain-containing protein